jgi:hypothetical protein
LSNIKTSETSLGIVSTTALKADFAFTATNTGLTPVTVSGGRIEINLAGN